jgi:hypothetical protein
MGRGKTEMVLTAKCDKCGKEESARSPYGAEDTAAQVLVNRGWLFLEVHALGESGGVFQEIEGKGRQAVLSDVTVKAIVLCPACDGFNLEELSKHSAARKTWERMVELEAFAVSNGKNAQLKSCYNCESRDMCAMLPPGHRGEEAFRRIDCGAFKPRTDGTRDAIFDAEFPRASGGNAEMPPEFKGAASGRSCHYCRSHRTCKWLTKSERETPPKHSACPAFAAEIAVDVQVGKDEVKASPPFCGDTPVKRTCLGCIHLEKPECPHAKGGKLGVNIVTTENAEGFCCLSWESLGEKSDK